MRKTRSRTPKKAITCRSLSHVGKKDVELHTVVGLIGVVCYLLAYALMQMRKLTIDSYGYACLNIAGGIFGLYSLSHDFNLAAAISQAMWLIFTLVGMHASYRRRGALKNKLPPFDTQQ